VEGLAVSNSEQIYLERGNYVAEVRQGRGAKPFWYYIVKRKNASGIIDLVQFSTHGEAIAAAQAALARLNHATRAE